MLFSKEKVQAINLYLCEKISDRDFDLIEKTAKTFDITKQTVYRYLQKLQESKIIKKEENFYSLLQKEHSFSYKNIDLQEDRIFDKDIRSFLVNLPQNVQDIWYYAFTEMFNNAIDHSESPNISCLICQDYIDTAIVIVDQGVGIFNKIMNYYKYSSLDNAINELFKGKLTTDTKNHSGEGIFFTSRVLDYFQAMSSGKVFTHNNDIDVTRNLEDSEILKKFMNRKGTVIYMQLGNNSQKELKEVFDMYADVDGGFNKTSIPIKNIFEHGYPVSRSQAKRLYNRFDKFSSVELDFRGVEQIGQGFAHELFVVFQNAHPDIPLIVVNQNETIQSMIDHVKNTI